MVKVLLLKFQPFMGIRLMMLYLHVVTQLFQFTQERADTHKVRPSKHDIPPFSVFQQLHKLAFGQGFPFLGT
jgi:hypothetical protein